MEPQIPNPYEESFNSIKKQINEGYRKITQAKKTVTIVGLTGSGKSTLLNLIAGNTMVAKRDQLFGRLFLDVEYIGSQQNRNELHSQRPQIIIGNSTISKTFFPNKWIDSEGIVYWDCPGFDDTNGFEHEIINSFYIKRIFECSKQVKLVIVISQSMISQRVKQFLHLLQSIQKLFVNLESMLESVSFVLTQTAMSANNLQRFIVQRFLPEQMHFLSQKQKKLIDRLQKKVCFFPTPQQIGLIDPRLNEPIKQMISQLEYTNQPKIQISVVSSTLNKLEDFARLINTEVEDICKQTNHGLENNCKKIIDQKSSYDEVCKWLLQIKQSVCNLSEIKELEQFMAGFTKLIKEQILDQMLEQKMITCIKQLKFIQSIKSTIKLNIKSWSQNFKVMKLLDKLLQQPLVDVQKDCFRITICAPIVGTKKIAQIIQQRFRNIKEIIIFCYHTLYVDQDLSYPGISFSILSKNWIIIGNKKITLKGQNGENYYERNAYSYQVQDYEGNGLSGENGLPGKPGQTGGSFYGKIMPNSKRFGPGILQIDVRGGNGGNGQNGGNGANGRDGLNAPKQPVEDRDRSFLISRQRYTWDNQSIKDKVLSIIKKIGTFNDQRIELYRSRGYKGKQGGDGGAKGAHGLPGFSGQIKFDKATRQNIRTYTGNGIKGKEGKPGKYGKGGKNGDNFEGIYLDQSLFTGFREKGQIIKEIIQQEIQQQEEFFSKSAYYGKQALKHTSKTIMVDKVTNLVKTPIIELCSKSIEIASKKFKEQALFNAVNEASKKGLNLGSFGLVQKSAQVSNTILGGFSSFGVSFVIQGAISLGCAYCFSGWQEKKFKQNGYAPHGKISQLPNSINQQKPPSVFQIDDSHMEKVEKLFSQQKDIFLQSLNYNIELFQ